MLPVFIFLVAIISCAQTADPTLDAAVAAMQKWYDQKTGLWNNTANGIFWWNSANCLTSLIDYMILTGNKQYQSVIEDTYNKARNHPGTKDFTNEYIDDVGWWGLAWVRAYDLTHDKKYLDMAQHDADYMYSFHDNVCKGGLYWKNDKKGKNAIENELYIKLAASLHNRINGDKKNLDQAKQTWEWFKGTGMINNEHLVNDGLESKTCKPQGATFTYNQGVILGGLEQLYHATNDKAYLDTAVQIANAATKSTHLNPKGVLSEGSDDCNGDGPSFKGIFVRNLGELARTLKDKQFHPYLTKQRDSAVAHARNNANQYGNHWDGPNKGSGNAVSAACQHGAIDLLLAAIYS